MRFVQERPPYVFAENAPVLVCGGVFNETVRQIPVTGMAADADNPRPVMTGLSFFKQKIDAI